MVLHQACWLGLCKLIQPCLLRSKINKTTWGEAHAVTSSFEVIMRPKRVGAVSPSIPSVEIHPKAYQLAPSSMFG
eukprot:scaffold168026_cov34-Prasinocladus_malaysianus.AAC.1